MQQQGSIDVPTGRDKAVLAVAALSGDSRRRAPFELQVSS
jgi:hypothetical protein